MAMGFVKLFNTGVYRFNVLKIENADNVPLKMNFFCNGIYRDHRYFGPDNFQGNDREAGPRPDIKQTVRSIYVGSHAERINEMLDCDLFIFRYRSQVNLAVPFFQFGSVESERIDLTGRKPYPHCLRFLRSDIAYYGAHYSAFPFQEEDFKAIARIEIAAGVTPGIRDACPRVSGLFFESFSRTSVVRLLTAA